MLLSRHRACRSMDDSCRYGTAACYRIGQTRCNPRRLTAGDGFATSNWGQLSPNQLHLWARRHCSAHMHSLGAALAWEALFLTAWGSFRSVVGKYQNEKAVGLGDAEREGGRLLKSMETFLSTTWTTAMQAAFEGEPGSGADTRGNGLSVLRVRNFNCCRCRALPPFILSLFGMYVQVRVRKPRGQAKTKRSR